MLPTPCRPKTCCLIPGNVLNIAPKPNPPGESYSFKILLKYIRSWNPNARNPKPYFWDDNVPGLRKGAERQDESFAGPAYWYSEESTYG